mgnify:CR=1 FL=1
MRGKLFALLVTLSLLLAGCTSEEKENGDSTEYVEEPQLFPTWDEITDDETNWSSQRLEGQAYIVIFSAQWCNLPCMDLMHTIWDTIPEINVMVMSTDNGSEISFKDWHDSADAHDDEEGDANNNLTTYKFLLGDEEGNILGIESPGTTVFVNKTGYITWSGKSSIANDPELITEQWGIANQD